MKYLQNALKQFSLNKTAPATFNQTECNYSNNYYGDQHCIASESKSNKDASDQKHH